MMRIATRIGQRRRQRQGSTPARRVATVAGTVAVGALLLAACGTAGNAAAASHATEQGRVVAAGHTAGCTTTVHGVVPGPGSLAAQWLPAGFHLTSGTSSDPTSGLTYSAAGSDPPRVELHLSNSSGPLTAAAGGRSTATAVEVQAHAALLEDGPPDPQFIGVYWKPTASDLLSVVGYKLPSVTVIEVAQHVAFSASGVVSLPVKPGPIVTKSTAIAVARQATHLTRSSAQAKLSSWTEVSALLQAGHVGAGITVPPGVTDAPWKPVWAVLLSGSSSSTGSSTPSAGGEGELAVVDATSGQPLITTAIGAGQAWFTALTNRDPTLAACPGGSTARLPFGVLTRDEETYVTAVSPGPPAQGATKSVILKLATVPALDHADPGLYGGCVQQSCSLNELVWTRIVVVHAPPGKTLACLPPWASYPPGYQPKQVHQYVTISVAGNAGIDCGAVPTWVSQLANLAPPAVK